MKSGKSQTAAPRNPFWSAQWRNDSKIIASSRNTVELWIKPLAMQGGPQKCTLKLQGFKPDIGEGGSGGATVSKLDAKSREWTDVSLTTSEDPADQVVNGELEFKRHA